MPWVKLKHLWNSLQKRKRRELKLQANLHSLGMSATMGAAFGGGTAPAVADDGPDDAQIASLAAQGFPVIVRRVGGEEG